MSRSSPDLHGLLANLPLFNALSPDEIEMLVEATREVRVERGTVLFHKGDAASGLWLIVYGQVKLVFPAPNGMEKVLQIFGPGQSFGEAMMFLDRQAPVYAQALDDGLILHVGRQAILDAIERDSGFSCRLLAGLSMRLHQLVLDVEAYSLRSAAQRVIGYLLQAAPVDVEAEAGFSVQLPATKMVIASRLNLTPETLSRVFAQLTQEGLITVHGREVVVHAPSRLRDFQ